MPIPAVGNVVTPTNFLAVSAQGQVVLTWSAAPLVTLYYINRSTDDVTYTNIGSTTGLQYNDSTGVVNTIYYYQIQASNGTYSSLSSASVTAQSLKPGQTTVGNLVLECQQRTDRVYSDNITTQEWTSMINQSYKELYDILTQKFGDDYFLALPYTYTTTGQVDSTYNAQVFPLPDDFYKLLRCEVALNASDPNSWVTLREFQFIQGNLWNYPNIYTFYGITNLRYRLMGNYLWIVPIASSGQTIRIWYNQRPDQLITSTDTVDGVSGWEEYIVADVCIKALAKTEEDITVFAGQKMALLKRIEEAAENRNVGEPEVVSDSRIRNFGWSDDSGGYGWSGGW